MRLSRFARLGSWCHDRRRFVVVLWFAALLVGNGVAGRDATPAGVGVGVGVE